MSRENKQEEKYLNRQYEVALFTGETREELAENIKSAVHKNYIPVTEIITVELSKLGGGIEDGFLQVFSKKR